MGPRQNTTHTHAIARINIKLNSADKWLWLHYVYNDVVHCTSSNVCCVCCVYYNNVCLLGIYLLLVSRFWPVPHNKMVGLFDVNIPMAAAQCGSTHDVLCHACERHRIRHRGRLAGPGAPRKTHVNVPKFHRWNERWKCDEHKSSGRNRELKYSIRVWDDRRHTRSARTNARENV